VVVVVVVAVVGWWRWWSGGRVVVGWWLLLKLVVVQVAGCRCALCRLSVVVGHCAGCRRLVLILRVPTGRRRRDHISHRETTHATNMESQNILQKTAGAEETAGRHTNKEGAHSERQK